MPTTLPRSTIGMWPTFDRKSQYPLVPYAGPASQINAFMQQQAVQPYLANLPDYQSMVTQRSANIGAGLRGEVPQDVRNLIGQAGAQRGVMTGQAPGSPNANAAWLRALGLTSLGQQTQAAGQLGQAIEQTPTAAIWNPTELYAGERKARSELEAAQAGEKGARPWWETIEQGRGYYSRLL